MNAAQRMIELARKDIRETLTDDEVLVLASDLDEWKRILLIEETQALSELRALRTELQSSMAPAIRTKKNSRAQMLVAYRISINAKIQAINDQIRKRNIALSEGQDRRRNVSLRAFLHETRDMLPFEEPYLDWHVRCAALLEEK